MENVPAADYALLPNAVCWHPPVRHRHTSYWLRGLTPLSIYLLGGVLIAARAALAPQRHKKALAAGAAAIRREVETSRRFFDRMESAEHYGWRTPTKGRAIRYVGSVEYMVRSRALRRRAPKQVALDVSARRLLRMAGLGLDAQNFRAVEAALNRLTRPVGAGGCEMPAPLRDWERLPSGRLRLRVDGSWLPARRFKRVLWPPPKRSPAALAFALLACVLDTRPINKKEVTERSFAESIGLDPGMNTGARREAINRAFGVVNVYLANLPDAVVRRMWERKVELPGALTCEAITDGKIRVVAVPRRKVYDAATATTRPVGMKTSIKRAASRRKCVGVLRSDQGGSVGDLRSAEEEVWGTCDPGVGDLRSADQQEGPGPQGFSPEFRAAYKKEMQERLIMEEEDQRKSAARDSAAQFVREGGS